MSIIGRKTDEITLKHFSLKKKWLRTELVDSLMATLDKQSVRHKRGPGVKDPIKRPGSKKSGLVSDGLLQKTKGENSASCGDG
jgi:hypothetical protein